MAELFRVRLFTKMKMRRQRMLEKMHQEKSDQDPKQRPRAGKMQRFRNYLQERHRQHVSGAQREKILKKLPRPISSHDEIAANQIPRRGHQPQPRRQRRPYCQFVSHMECGSPAAAFAITCSSDSYPREQAVLTYPIFSVPSVLLTLRPL